MHLRDLSNLDVVYDFCLDHVAPAELVLAAMDAVAKDDPQAPAEFLGKVLSENVLFRTIEDFLVAPRSLEEVTEHLMQTVRAGADETYLHREVEAYLLLGAKAKLAGQPLIRPTVHQPKMRPSLHGVHGRLPDLQGQVLARRGLS
jgi:hypothetical protein